MATIFTVLLHDQFVFADSHKELGRLILEMPESCRVINIDHHHDCYDLGGDILNCGNWGNVIRTYEKVQDFIWLPSIDSDRDEKNIDINDFISEIIPDGSVNYLLQNPPSWLEEG